jgi:hypothetical protein
MRNLKFLAGIGSLVLAFASPQLLATEAEYYTWVDENGVTNYAEKEPSGYNARFVTREESRFGYSLRPQGDALPQQVEPETPDTSAEAVPDDAEQPDIDQQVAAERARVDAEIAAAKRSNCQIGRRNLAQLEAYARIRVKDDDGEERVLTDAEKAERIRKAKQTIRENCTG